MFSSEPVVQVKDAVVFQGRNPILKEVNFSIEKGEFVFLVGRTGSGKTSLLKILYADIPLRMGRAKVAGFNIYDIKRRQVPLLRRKLGIVFQDFQLFPDRTIGENLHFVMRATGWKEGIKMKSRIAEVLIKVGLGTMEKKMPHQLSGGEQQRTVIARALLNEPVMLIADEPTGNLDPEVSDGIMELFLEINKSGATVLMATHSHALIKKYPARILKCKNGKMLDSQKNHDHPSKRGTIQ